MVAQRAHWEVVKSPRNGRTAPRRKLHLEVQGVTLSGAAAMVLIHNMSMSGLLIETAAKLTIGEAFELEIPDAGAKSAVVIWSSGRLFGCEFEDPVPTAAISAALLRTPLERSYATALEKGHPGHVCEPDISEAGKSKHHAKLSLRTRALIIGGSSFFGWAFIIWVIVMIAG